MSEQKIARYKRSSVFVTRAAPDSKWCEAERVAALEAKLSKMEGLDIQISDGDVWLIFPDAAISIESICNSRAPGPIVQRRLREWKDKALAEGEEA